MSKIADSVNTLKSTLGLSKLSSKNAGNSDSIHVGAKTKFMGNLFTTRIPDANNYGFYFQDEIMQRMPIASETNNNGQNSIIRSRLTYYQDWRAILRIAPITSSKYTERNYAMFGRGGARTSDEEAKEMEIANKGVKGYEQVIDYNTSLLRVLTEIGGILFPYTPQINVSGTANWEKQQLTHTNIVNYSWQNSEPESYDISGDFTASNPAEALYCLAIFNFLRTITKGSGPNYNRATNGKTRYEEDSSSKLGRTNGASAGMAREIPGAAPPVLYLSAYGDAMIHEVPVVVQSYSYTLEKDIDYVELILDPKQNWAPVNWMDGQMTQDRRNNQGLEDMVISRVPTRFSLSMKLLTNINPIKYRQFSLWDYKNGEYLKPHSKVYGFNTGWTW